MLYSKERDTWVKMAGGSQELSCFRSTSNIRPPSGACMPWHVSIGVERVPWCNLRSKPSPCFPFPFRGHHRLRSNTRSVADIGSDRALLPMKLQEGWQRVNIDLERTVRLVFGSSYLTTSQIVIRASARIAKVFFQSQPFSDYELPGHLRVVAE